MIGMLLRLSVYLHPFLCLCVLLLVNRDTSWVQVAQLVCSCCNYSSHQI